MALAVSASQRELSAVGNVYIYFGMGEEWWSMILSLLRCFSAKLTV